MDPGSVISLGIPIGLIVLGLVVGRAREQRHLTNLQRREAGLSGMLVSDVRSYAPDVDSAVAPSMMVSEAVIATDYLKTMLARLRNIFGGEVGSYLSLVTRARREALLRMLEQAKANGYNAVCNVRLEAADIGANTSGRGVPMAAMIASGTAYRREGSAVDSD